MPSLHRAARQKLQDLARSGVTHLPRRRSKAQPTAPEQSALSPPASPTPVVHVTPAPTSLPAPAPIPTAVAEQAIAANLEASLFEAVDRLPAVPPHERPAILAAIAAEVAACRRCPVLVGCRTQTVFGVGNPNAELCFVGEAPGRDEDAQGEPFIGKAGQLLNRIIDACKLRREEVYICNVLKCRPPDNRTPMPDEVANCHPFLERQLDVLRPRFICALGGVAAHALLGTSASMARLRGRFHRYRDCQVICTYHPAYLLRNPDAKAAVWEDMKMLMAAMGRPVA